MAEGRVKFEAHDATAEADERDLWPTSDDQMKYLADRVDELTAGVEKAKAVAAGATQTAKTLADELKQAKADLRAARAGREG